MTAHENLLFELFPTPVLFCKRVLHRDRCAELITKFSPSAKQENSRDKELTHTQILAPQIDDGLSFVESCIHPHLVEMGVTLFGEKLNWSIKEMWINFLKPGAAQAMHHHANAFVSGVLYLTPTHPSSQTVFVKGFGERGFVFKNTNSKSETNAFNAEKWIAPEPDAGDLILFPSHLLHEVPVNQGDLRVSLAFNAIPDRLDAWGYGISFSA